MKAEAGKQTGREIWRQGDTEVERERAREAQWYGYRDTEAGMQVGRETGRHRGREAKKQDARRHRGRKT